MKNVTIDIIMPDMNGPSAMFNSSSTIHSDGLVKLNFKSFTVFKTNDRRIPVCTHLS